MAHKHAYIVPCVRRCNKKPNDTNPECIEEEKYKSSGYCGVLLDSTGPFAVCHAKVNPNVSHAHPHAVGG